MVVLSTTAGNDGDLRNVVGTGAVKNEVVKLGGTPYAYTSDVQVYFVDVDGNLIASDIGAITDDADDLVAFKVNDDGRLTDNKGRTVDFRNTIIIMTSNMGSQVIQENFAEAFNGKKLPEEVVERTRLAVIDLLKQQLKPEFLNRIDEIVMFEPLTHKDIERIVDIQLGIVRKMLSENGIRLEYSDKAREWIAAAGYDPLYGARPVKRVIQRYVVNDLSKRILAGEVDRSKPISIDAGKDGLSFSN